VTPDYSPISDYAIIGDCRSAALVSRTGSIDWWCLPRFDSPPVFAAILDHARGGSFRVAPAAAFSSSRRYVGRTAVLETTFTTSSGALRLIDAMPVADEEVKARSLWPEHEVLRSLEVIDGEVEVEIVYQPRLVFATAPARITMHPHQALMVERGRVVLLLRTEVPLTVNEDGTEARGRCRLRAGERAVLALSFAQGSPVVLPALGDRARELVKDSVDWWERWSGQCRYDWNYRDEVLRSALTLKLLTYSPSGAIVAAPTTSLPESIGGVRNWDYRYCWLRDASLTLRALLDLGFTVEAESFLSWLLHATRLTQPKLQILYDVYGEAHLPERSLEPGRLPGIASRSHRQRCHQTAPARRLRRGDRRRLPVCRAGGPARSGDRQRPSASRANGLRSLEAPRRRDLGAAEGPAPEYAFEGHVLAGARSAHSTAGGRSRARIRRRFFLRSRRDPRDGRTRVVESGDGKLRRHAGRP